MVGETDTVGDDEPVDDGLPDTEGEPVTETLRDATACDVEADIDGDFLLSDGVCVKELASDDVSEGVSEIDTDRD